MKEKINRIIKREIGDSPQSIREIVGLGIVNQVYEVEGKENDFVIRLNDDSNQIVAYKKESWCLNKVKQLKIACPQVLKIGEEDGLSFMIQNKIDGKNGSLCTERDKLIIWNKLGQYASLYNNVKRIEVKEVNKQEFHKNWKARLMYNIKQLNVEDELLKRGILNKEEHKKAVSILKYYEAKNFTEGLVHGDLCPRNVIMSHEEKIYLLDWGTAEINVVPHHEIGLVLLSKETNENEFELFLKGYGISRNDFEEMRQDILTLNFLHRLDKYRWAENYNKENIKEYEEKIKESFKELMNVVGNKGYDVHAS